MKNLFLPIFLMLFVFAGYANNYEKLEKIDSKTKTSLISQNESSETNPFDDGYFATCSVTIRNTITGQTRQVNGIGHGATRSDAINNCAQNARAAANALVDKLNGQM